jgi:hypothetical protein
MNRTSHLRKAALVSLIGFLLVAIEAHAQPIVPTGETAFLGDSGTAMTTMMNSMMISASGNVDHDFVLMMIPHHQGAIAMAQAELRYGKSEQLRRIAQEIVVNQVDEIAAMRLVPFTAPTPTHATPSKVDSLSSSATGASTLHQSSSHQAGP